jgi:hypothetical protein
MPMPTKQTAEPGWTRDPVALLALQIAPTNLSR